MASGDTKTQQYLDIAARGTRADLQRGCCNTRTQDLIMDVAERIITEEETRYREDQILQGEIDEIKNNPDVYDIVPTYAALQAYDTSTITDKDIIRVLRDETHDNASTYYRWDAADQEFDYIGETGDYYTKAQVNALLALKADKATTYTKTETDALLDGKQDVLTAGENITIEDESGSLVISATDTTYSDFTGTDGTVAGEAGLVPAPATTDAGKYLKADGTWDTVQAGPTVVQTTGTSTTDVMSQNATTSMVYADPGSGTGYNQKVRMGDGATVSGTRGVAIGAYSSASGLRSVALGDSATATGRSSVALAYSSANNKGEFAIGVAGTEGYNSSAYRLISGVYDGQSAHDAATKGQLDSIAIRGAGAPTTSTVGTVGQLYEDGTNGALYQLKSIDITVTPNTYNWEEVGAGGSGGGMREVTSADFNWPTANPDGVATWLLSDGIYYSKATKLYFNTSANVTGNRSFIKSTTGNGSSLTASFYGNSGGNNVNVYLTNTNGSDAWSNTIVSLADIYADPSTKRQINIGDSATGSGNFHIALGASAGTGTADSAIAIGRIAQAQGKFSVALGAFSEVDADGQVSIGMASNRTQGYNNTQYRLLSGLYDPQSAHDAATKGYVDPTTDSSAPTSATVGRLGQIQIDTTNADAYMCVAVDSVTPSYTWKKITV